MNFKYKLQAIAILLFLAVNATAQIGKPFIHDPSTIMESDGKYYTFGTGGGGLISEDGWTWNSGA
ncbi:MAG: glycoside hydrolase, partial [Fermentimonas sp.]|nr:glycoside hydrolase [Fermentimonas sp.]